MNQLCHTLTRYSLLKSADTPRRGGKAPEPPDGEPVGRVKAWYADPVYEDKSSQDLLNWVREDAPIHTVLTPQDRLPNGYAAGMMSLFSGLGDTGLSDTAALAKGIGLILNATLMGLLIAIPCLIFWSYYNKKVETMAVEMETLCDEFIRRQYRGINQSS